MSEYEDDDVDQEVDVDQEDDAGDAPSIAERSARVTLVNGESFTVVVRNRDYLSWDMTAVRKKWDAQAQPFLFTNFLAYSAAKREGLFTGTFDGREDSSWWNAVDDVEQKKAAVPVRPTRPAAARD
jgi:hypothetical protein